MGFRKQHNLDAIIRAVASSYSVWIPAPAPVGKLGGPGPAYEIMTPPTRIHKVWLILQETTATLVLYTLPAVEVRQLVINVGVYSLLMTHS